MIKKIFCIIIVFLLIPANVFATDGGAENEKKYIKWVDFDVSSSALADSADIDIKTYGGDEHVGWIELLAYLGAKYGGDFSRYKKSDIDAAVIAVRDGTANEMKYYSYYLQAYGAVLSGMLGEYCVSDGDTLVKKYGIKAFFPFAKGYYYSEFDDFGTQRTYGYRRPHLGHDMMGSVGTPIVAVESGYVEALGWNQYGGWRVGIRSFDGKRYYYYAHLRASHPYGAGIVEGATVQAGQVIGYLGMTGYSTKEGVSNITTPHLHIGMQLIFDKSQKDGVNQIWIDMYQIVKFLSSRRSAVEKRDGDYYATSPIIDMDIPD